MKPEIRELIKRLESEICKTPTGELRNLLCDLNIVIQSLVKDVKKANSNKKCRAKKGEFPCTIFGSSWCNECELYN